MYSWVYCEKCKIKRFNRGTKWRCLIDFNFMITCKLFSQTKPMFLISFLCWYFFFIASTSSIYFRNVFGYPRKLQINKTLTESFVVIVLHLLLLPLMLLFSVGNFRQSIKNTSIKIKTNEFKLLRQYYFFAPDFWFIDKIKKI